VQDACRKQLFDFGFLPYKSLIEKTKAMCCLPGLVCAGSGAI